MRRALLFCGGILLSLAAEAILWNAPLWYTHGESRLSSAFTRIVGLALIVQGALAALGAALCFGRAIFPLTLSPVASSSSPAAVRGWPVLLICGLLFLLAAAGPLRQAARESKGLKEAERMPGSFSPDAIDYFRRLLWTQQTFGALWVVLGGTLLVAPLFLEPRVTRIIRRLNAAGCRIAIGGFLLSGLGSLVWLGAALAGAFALGRGSNELSLVGLVAILAGAIVTVGGSIFAGLGRQ